MSKKKENQGVKKGFGVLTFKIEKDGIRVTGKMNLPPSKLFALSAILNEHAANLRKTAMEKLFEACGLFEANKGKKH